MKKYNNNNHNHQTQYMDLPVQIVRFNVFSASEIRKLSVVSITNTSSFDAIGNPCSGGLYDVAMGPSSRNEICSTCMNNKEMCAGHFGHIELVMPVFNPFFIKTLHKIFTISCLSCFRLQIPDHIKRIIELQLQLVDAGYIIEAQELEIYKSEVISESNNQVDEESTSPFHPKFEEYHQLLLNEPLNHHNITKNTEAIRTAIVNSAVRGNTQKLCKHCKVPLKRVKYTYKKLVIYVTKKEMESLKKDSQDSDPVRATNKILFAEECRKYFVEILKYEKSFLKLLFPVLKNTNGNECDVFFMDVLPVIPPIVRPANILRGGLLEHPQTKTYQNVLSTNNQLRYILAFSKTKSSRKELECDNEIMKEAKMIFNLARGDTPHEKIYYKWQELQTNVDQTLDIKMSSSSRNEDGFGLKQILEKKEGLIRMHMMGKRVNYAARTVITPDPNINIDQVGIPEAFALKLTYPVPVTTWNVSELRKMVLNGPKVHPGACYIEYDGSVKQIIPDDIAKREALANSLLTPNESRGFKTVHRHLLNGDILLFNRQPTLHKPSIMAHKARILKGEKTFRLHYSNCKAYNADFDGDEMNAHFPQNELARSEAYNLVNVANQYLVPKDGTPLGGLIQDHVISGVKISMRGRFFNREDYHQLVFQSLSHIKGNLKFLPPAILKPQRLWSGKQVLSTLILNLIPDGVQLINLQAKAKVSANAFQIQKPRPWKAGGSPINGIEMSEAEVIVKNGELLCGILDKNHYGSTPYSLIHCMYELYGGEVSTQLLSSFARLFTFFLQWEGFTLGVHDILVDTQANEVRQNIIEESRKSGMKATTDALKLPETTDLDTLSVKLEEAYSKDSKFRVILDRKYKSVLDVFTNEINKTCLPAGLICKFPENNLQLMVMSGAKGSAVNTMQISCLLGQIELEGKRPPLMISGKSLPSFSQFETSPKSGGFIDGRFMTGIKPQDFFFHCMAGREGLIDTAVKTSRSGYLQRCLIKHLEGLSVNYDGSVRDCDNSVVQFMYGEDGLDISKAQFLKENQMSFLSDNLNVIVTPQLLDSLQNTPEETKKLNKCLKEIRSWKKHNSNQTSKIRTSGFTLYANEIQSDIEMKNPHKIKMNGRSKLTKKLLKKWNALSEEEKLAYSKMNRECPDPVLSIYKPHQYFGSISENAEKLLENYLKNKKQNKREVKNMIYTKVIKSLAVPGEPVGLIAAQSIGEPSTQMTLNTFHFAGRGEMNVTLGIPRLREILMMASRNIKTPSMDIPFLNQNSKKLEKTAEKFRVRLNRVTVADVLESINVKSRLNIHPKRCREFELTFNFLSHDSYKYEFGVKPSKIMKHMHEKFFHVMFRYITKAAVVKLSYVENEKDGGSKNDEKDIDSSSESPAEKDKPKNDESSDEESLADDADATDERKRARNIDQMDYDELEESGEKQEVLESSDEESDNELDVEALNSSNENEDEIKILTNEDSMQLDEIEKREELKEELNADDQKILDTLMKQNSSATGFLHDSQNFRWCQIKFELPMKYKNIDLTNVLRETAKSSVIWEIPHIKRAITYQQDDELIIKTDGININAMFQYDKILDLKRLYTNDIHAIAKTYGIEAAGRVIVKEVQNVFKVYGITVDPRHLLLIADYMTFDGTFQPLSRRGMESSASPLQQISFESSLQFLKTATIEGRVDNISSPSSCLMLGHPVKTGTGAFSLINNLSFAL